MAKVAYEVKTKFLKYTKYVLGNWDIEFHEIVLKTWWMGKRKIIIKLTISDGIIERLQFDLDGILFFDKKITINHIRRV